MNTLKKKNGNEYLVFDSTSENKEVLSKYTLTLGWDQKFDQKDR